MKHMNEEAKREFANILDMISDGDTITFNQGVAIVSNAGGEINRVYYHFK